MASRSDIDSLKRQLANLEDSLRLIDERKSQYVLSTDIPLQIVREERELNGEISRIRAELARVESADVSERPPIEFVDRERELQLLNVERQRALRSPYTLIGAPAGYGKTCLLQRTIGALQSEETIRQRWSFCHVRLDQREGEISCIAQSITGQPLPAQSDVLVDSICNYVVQELATRTSGGRRAVLLIFDAVERLDEKARQWLYTLLYELYKRTRAGLQEIVVVRVVIAGRNVGQFWEGYAGAHPTLPAPQRISLSPFDEHPIQELIWSRAKAARIVLDDRAVTQIAHEVHYLSGGHPKVICSLVDDLAGQLFAIGPVSEYFEQRRGQLVREYLSPVAADLLHGLDDEIGKAVQTLSVFRRVNANTVQALVDAGVLPSATNEVDLLGNLQGTHLLDGPSIEEPFYRDRLMRRVLALDMAHRSLDSRSLYRRLNGVALDLYASWVRNLAVLPDSYLKSTQRLLSVVEWLFHALQDQDIGKDELRLGLQAQIKALSEGDRSLSVADLIVDAIQKDAEVCYLLRRRLGSEGVAVACGWLQPS